MNGSLKVQNKGKSVAINVKKNAKTIKDNQGQDIFNASFQGGQRRNANTMYNKAMPRMSSIEKKKDGAPATYDKKVKESKTEWK